MIEKRLKNKRYFHPSGKSSVYDLTVPPNWNQKMILFLHGYMGYKDWGAWHLMESFFVDRQFGFLKFNFSHNGGTVDQPIDFNDLESFSKNTYTKEMEDVTAILTELQHQLPGSKEIYLVGHSRGGGIAALHGKHPAISKIALLAPISSIEDRFPTGDALKKWQAEGVYYRLNGRTNQQMPHRYIQYEDYLQNMEQLDIEKACRNTTIPFLVIHGANDTSVTPENGKKIAQWSKGTFVLLEDTAHTFGAQQPWDEKALPLALRRACEELLDFFNSAS